MTKPTHANNLSVIPVILSSLVARWQSDHRFVGWHLLTSCCLQDCPHSVVWGYSLIMIWRSFVKVIALIFYNYGIKIGVTACIRFIRPLSPTGLSLIKKVMPFPYNYHYWQCDNIVPKVIEQICTPKWNTMHVLVDGSFAAQSVVS